MTIMDPLTPANKALFDGNRGDIPELLTAAPQSGRTLWLMAAATDDDAAYFALLARVHATGEQPYANMALEILEREKYFATEIARSPKWQIFLQQHKKTIIRLLMTVPVLLLVLWLGNMFIFPRATATSTIVPTQANRSASTAQETIEPTTLPTATVTPLPISQSVIINYMPIGSLRLLNVEYPTLRAVSAGTTPATAPEGSAFAAIQYEFTCGTAQAFCDTPPQAQLDLELSDASLGIISSGGLTLQGNIPAGRITSGSSIMNWIVFAIPRNQSPRRLLIGLSTDEDADVDTTLTLDLPR